ncbi:hypothetical protein KP509_1Z044900 [Ceratopteris richardii]|nr:hypothetical protein KP509_1Z044900 [Ceratopteris richardii]
MRIEVARNLEETLNSNEALNLRENKKRDPEFYRCFKSATTLNSPSRSSVHATGVELLSIAKVALSIVNQRAAVHR